MPALWIGTSGWVYKHWMGVFYPEKMPGEELLPFFAGRFPTVEVNFSYYRLPERSVFEAWRRQTPSSFLFAVKGSRYLTHMKKLKDPEQPLERLMHSAGGLQEKLGPILFQFPRWWSVNVERLRQFLDALQAYPGQRYAFEFRHRSWLAPEVYALLQRHNAALCLPVGWDIPLEVCQTANWTYIRFHGGAGGSIGFSDDELATWAGRIRSLLDQGADCYAYFNNDPEGHAVRDAERLRGLLG
jgi:uncharacterized protein YecE (DUF72 family)